MIGESRREEGQRQVDLPDLEASRDDPKGGNVRWEDLGQAKNVRWEDLGEAK